MLYASPGIGDAAATAILGCGCAVILVAVIMFIVGLVFLATQSSERRRKGRILILASVLWTIGWYLLPRCLFWLNHGTMPIDRSPEFRDKFFDIKKGMTEDKVQELIGPAHEVLDLSPDAMRWYYFHNSFGLNYSGVEFDNNGNVQSVFTD